MDPQATLDLAAEFLAEAEKDPEAAASALGCLNDYNEWRARGGFEPEGGDFRAFNLRVAIASRYHCPEPRFGRWERR